MNFKNLQLSPLLLKVLVEKGCTNPFPIQEQAIPYALAGRDGPRYTQTDTGKSCLYSTNIVSADTEPESIWGK